jgi:hypothetical protein
VRTVGPGLALAVLLSAIVVVAASQGLVSTGLALGLLVVPYLILFGFCARWLFKGCIVVKPNQVILRGYMHVIDKEGHRKTAYIRQYVPRAEWNSISVEGLFFPAVTWSRYGETIIFGHVSRAYLLRKLLAAPRAEFDRTLPLSPLLVFFVGTAKRLGAAINTGIEAIARLIPGTRPHLTATMRWVLRATRRAAHAIGRRLVALSVGSRSVAIEYARFVAFCRRYLLDQCSTEIRGERAAFYLQTLGQAHIVLPRTYGPLTYGPQANDDNIWMLHPSIHSVDDITRRIPQHTFEKLWFENVLRNIDVSDVTAGELTRIPASAN